ncbi:ASCH domain-containing protein [Neobacillus citreus]|uniref:ASCH domain-containing protein n=1 Tax=Neobacillus citreus TaxID=2833578 RepID=A0A942T7E0_9BACI|nr:ASCH domain-containing protein [Neobacillus citreus]MCH6264859.1 ASCH domain-containing protein [Neobacillus citreus]
MKILSMIQPWASLFVLGESKYETRTWRTNYRGPLAIHTSKKPDKAACGYPRVQELLQKHGYSGEDLPTGVIIGVCELKNCIRVIENNETWAVLEDGRVVSGIEFLLGDYRVGGYAWEVEGMRTFEESIPAKGQLGLWEYPGIIH